MGQDRGRARDIFVREGARDVGGWVSDDDFAVFGKLEDFQQAEGVRGNFCEIGVFEGKRFLFFLLSLRPGENAVAIDVFDDIVPRRDFEPVFRENVLRHARSLDSVRVLRKDSSTLPAADILKVAGGPVRVFSVDGSHEASAVEGDLRLASACLAPGGLLIADDYFNENWPGVSEGTLRFLMGRDGRESRLAPFAIFSTKLFLSHLDSAGQYLDFLREHSSPFSLTETRFLGRPVATIHRPQPRPTLAMRLARTALWQRVRTTRLDAALRRMRGTHSG